MSAQLEEMAKRASQTVITDPDPGVLRVPECFRRVDVLRYGDGYWFR